MALWGAGVDPIFFRVHRPSVDQPQGLHLFSCETVWYITCRTLQPSRFEPAAPRVTDQAVSKAVLSVAFFKNRPSDNSYLTHRDRSELQGLCIPIRAHRTSRKIQHWSSSDNAVEIGRIPLSLHQSLSSTIRAAFKIGDLGPAPVEGVDNFFRRNGDDVHGAMTIVDLSLGIVQCPTAIERVPLMPGICCRDRIAAHETLFRRQRQTTVSSRRDNSPQRRNTLEIELPVPVSRESDFKADFCIDVATYPAVFGQAAAGRNQGRRSDGGVLDAEVQEIRTVRGCCRLRGGG